MSVQEFNAHLFKLFRIISQIWFRFHIAQYSLCFICEIFLKLFGIVFLIEFNKPVLVLFSPFFDFIQIFPLALGKVRADSQCDYFYNRFSVLYVIGQVLIVHIHTMDRIGGVCIENNKDHCLLDDLTSCDL